MKANPLFAGVSEEAIKDAAGVAIERRFQPGETVLSQDESGEALHLLVQGAVRVQRLGSTQRERILSEMYAPGVLGETALLLNGERSATVTATLPTVTLMLYREHVEAITRRHPQVLWNLARLLAQRVTLLNDELIASGHSTDAALAHVLQQLYRQRVGAGVPDATYLPLSTLDLMQRLSSSRETVTRVIKRFEKQGLIVAEGSGGLRLLDVPGLEAFGLDDPE